MDAGKAVSTTTELGMIGWATSLLPWWRSSAREQVCVCTSVCAYVSCLRDVLPTYSGASD